MNNKKLLFIFSFLLISTLFISCDNNNGDNEEVFRFFDEIDFVMNPELSHTPENYVHLKFLEPPEAEFLEAPEQVIVKDTLQIAASLVEEGLDAPGSGNGVDHFIIEIENGDMYFLDADLRPESPDMLVAAIADAESGEVVAARRADGSEGAFFNLDAGTYIAMSTSDSFLAGASELKSGQESIIIEPPSVDEVLDNTMYVVWADKETPGTLGEAFVEAARDSEETISIIVPGMIIEVRDSELQSTIQERGMYFQTNYMNIFAAKIEEPNNQNTQDFNPFPNICNVWMVTAPEGSEPNGALDGFTDDEIETLNGAAMQIIAQ